MKYFLTTLILMVSLAYGIGQSPAPVEQKQAAPTPVEAQESTPTPIENQETSPAPLEEQEEIYKVVETMPRFPGCEDDHESNSEKSRCASGKMLQYIYANLKYPEVARNNGIEGTTVVQFVVRKDGTIGDVKLKRDIGGKCGQAALDVIHSMNENNIVWIPGNQRGRSVSVYFTLPIKFKLENQVREVRPVRQAKEEEKILKIRKRKGKSSDFLRGG